MANYAYKLLLIAVFLTLTPLAGSPLTAGQQDRAVSIAKLAKRSSIFIETDQGTGSGFVIADESVATNHHVIEGALKS